MVSMERVDPMWNGSAIYGVKGVVDAYQLGQMYTGADGVNRIAGCQVYIGNGIFSLLFYRRKEFASIARPL